ncbi:hypothetical protein [Dickeya fangzhongdai]|uniref:Uncharacterized protein n=1 Tax=Dickeya fangzhongdai TaxID=1778540 RepID=A0A2K8QKU7_9GAMM|nr:hypothetical protein [Dickeya fangzhongdai]ATZ94157.1 hypothetical protein CVE23_09380 [Dickeya fangzhongdai]QOH47592.1 hypothetical protein DYD82_09425 [Dickeya fangzhongdai]QOH51898.1 hypothetical protein DYD83_09425 [Dickeya fangzhongdai]WOY00905.1 hypothetical protein OGM22_03445 [Dickeya fangzhongdai]WOY03943.1 hypothetical protein OGM21_19195 [Dickeya fangzhongdai]
MKHVEKFLSASTITFALMLSGMAAAKNEEVFSKNTHLGNASGYCVALSRMDHKDFSDNKSVYYMPDDYLEATIAATTAVPRPIKLHVVFYKSSKNDTLQQCGGSKYREKDKHFYREFDVISMDDVS